MKRSILWLTALAGCIVACQGKNPEQNTQTTKTDAAASGPKTCYAYIKDKDTVMLSYTVAGNAVTGKFNYKLSEKDKNTGDISGLVKGDTIIADYTFNSEGRTSVRQVAFLKKGNQLLEGYGPTEEKDGKIAFTDVNGLKFVDAITLMLTDCK